MGVWVGVCMYLCMYVYLFIQNIGIEPSQK